MYYHYITRLITVDPPSITTQPPTPATDRTMSKADISTNGSYEVTEAPNAFVRKDKMPTFYGESFDLNDEEPPVQPSMYPSTVSYSSESVSPAVQVEVYKVPPSLPSGGE